MIRKSGMTIIVAGFFLFSWTFVANQNFPSEKVKAVYESMLGKSDFINDGFVYVKKETVVPINDSSLAQFLPATHFYFMEIYNGSHYEYNNGNILTVAAIDKTDTNNVKLLLPLDYCDKSTELLSIFLNKKINGNKEKTGDAIADLFQKTKNTNNSCCDAGINNLTHKNTWSRDTLIVTIQYSQNCCDNWIKNEKSQMKYYTSTYATKFVFNKDVLTNIDYSNWRK
jgi:hypothetical protein